MEAVAAAEVFEPLELHYSDMVLMSSFPISASLSSHDLERIESISDAVMLALGPSGPGLLSITGVPKAPALRHALLPIARKLALLGRKERAQVLKVGESADILSNGKLRSILHSVGRPSEMENLSRETFVVFLQPPWDKVLPTPSHLMDAKVKDEKTLASNDAKVKDEKTLESNDAQYVCHMVGSGNLQHQHQKIFDSIPPLSSRLRCGMTFAEFSRETTKQYYGGSGTQSGRQ